METEGGEEAREERESYAPTAVYKSRRQCIKLHPYVAQHIIKHDNERLLLTLSEMSSCAISMAD